MNERDQQARPFIRSVFVDKRKLQFVTAFSIDSNAAEGGLT